MIQVGHVIGEFTISGFGPSESEVIVSPRGDWVRIAPHATTDLAVLDVIAEILDTAE